MTTLIIKGIVALRRAPKGGIRHHASGRTFSGGQFIPAVLWDQQRQAGCDGLIPVLASVSDALQFLRQSYQQNAALTHVPAEVLAQYKIPTIPLSTVEARLKASIREAYAQAFLCGKRAAGNLTSLTPDDRKALLKTRRDEFSFLRKFLRDMRTGGGVMDYETRMGYYADAIRECFWLGFVRASFDPKRMIAWKRGPTSDSCEDCVRFEEHGPYPADEFWRDVASAGYLPQGGKLRCLGKNCKCRLEEV